MVRGVRRGDARARRDGQRCNRCRRAHAAFDAVEFVGLRILPLVVNVDSELIQTIEVGARRHNARRAARGAESS